jgi:hypothetical protein
LSTCLLTQRRVGYPTCPKISGLSIVHSLKLMNCPNCKTKFIKGARFCHQCGTENVTSVASCPHCETQNPANAKFCLACVQSMKKRQEETPKEEEIKEDTTKVYQPIYKINFLEGIPKVTEQIKRFFFQALKVRVKIQSSKSKYSDYLEAFYSSGFNYFFDSRIQQLTHILMPLKSMSSERASIKIDQILDEGFETLLDRFTIEHTKHLNSIQLPNEILRYQFLERKDIEINQMILDYLDIDQEKSEKVYTNFMSMPVAKIRNASQNFLFPARDEPILVICDQTVFGSCKEGFAFTTKGLYWKAHFNKAQKAYYTELYEVKKEEDWVNINGQYFHINPSLNFKISKLLKKLRSLN